MGSWNLSATSILTDNRPSFKGLSLGAGGLRSDANPGNGWPLRPGPAVGPTCPASAGPSLGWGPGGTPAAGLSNAAPPPLDVFEGVFTPTPLCRPKVAGGGGGAGGGARNGAPPPPGASRRRLYLSTRNKCTSACDAADYGWPVGEAGEAPEGDWQLHRAQERFEASVARARVWRARGPGYRLGHGVEHARGLGADEFQVRKAEAMLGRGLAAKGRRQALCGVLGMVQDCANGACGFRGYRRFRCKNRYCPTCGPAAFRELMARYAGLADVVERLVPGWQGDPHYRRRPWVVAKLDLTTRNLGRMPASSEVRLFNRLVRRFMRRVERVFGLPKRSWGLLWCDEFGGRNTNLHAHAVYVGPWLPQVELSRLWCETCEGTVFEGSFIVSIKRARSFHAALVHALKYPAKYISSSDPERLAELELAFHRVRRVHSMGAFYAVKSEGRDVVQGEVCPHCGSALRDVGGWRPVAELEAEGRVDVEQARRHVARVRVLCGRSP